MIEAYFLHLFIIICIYAILSMSLNLALGYTGLINLGHVAFYALGAYTSALLTLTFGISFWLSFLAGGIVAAFFGYLISFPTMRLRGDYLALGTLGLSIIIEAVLKNWISLTRGPLGLSGIPKPFFFAEKLNTLNEYALLMLLALIVVTVILTLIVRSPFGRTLRAIRDDEIAAKTLGKNIVSAKTKALVLSAFIAGIAGAFYAHYITFIDPSSFSINETILILSMVLVGGTGSLLGSIVGATVLVLLPEPLRFLPLPSTIVGGLRQAMYAGLLILIVMKRPEGIISEDTTKYLSKKIGKLFKRGANA